MPPASFWPIRPVVDGLPFYRQETVDLFRGANLHAATKNSRVSTP